MLRYKVGQKYDGHWDYFFHKEGSSNGGNRYATVLMYLSEWDEGGETVRAQGCCCCCCCCCLQGSCVTLAMPQHPSTVHPPTHPPFSPHLTLQVFPRLPAPPNRPGNWSECAKNLVAVKPGKGDAILFHSMKPNGELEERSMHGACPVIKGEKWSMTKW